MYKPLFNSVFILLFFVISNMFYIFNVFFFEANNSTSQKKNPQGMLKIAFTCSVNSEQLFKTITKLLYIFSQSTPNKAI